MSVLRVADRLRRAGLLVNFDEPIDLPNPKLPDLAIRCQLEDEPTYAEVSALGESFGSREAGATSWDIVSQVFLRGPALEYAGRIHKSLSGPHRAEVAGLVAAAAAQALAEAKFQAVEILGVLELGIALSDAASALSAWAEERGVSLNAVEGPELEGDEATRIRVAIKQEQHQLPTDRGGLLVIQNSRVFATARAPSRAIAKIEEEVYEYPHVASVIISGSHLGHVEGSREEIGPHTYFRHASHDLLVEHHIVLRNRFCRVPMPSALEHGLRKAFGEPLE
jgi:hypothetical protein